MNPNIMIETGFKVEHAMNHSRKNISKYRNKRAVERHVWTGAEDQLLTSLVRKYGAKQWSTIGSYFPTRCGKQARERWVNHLCPDVDKSSWTDEEDKIILETVEKIGTKWSEVVKILAQICNTKRSDNSVKNRWNNHMRKKRRMHGNDFKLPESVLRQQATRSQQTSQRSRKTKKSQSSSNWVTSSQELRDLMQDAGIDVKLEGFGSNERVLDLAQRMVEYGIGSPQRASLLQEMLQEFELISRLDDDAENCDSIFINSGGLMKTSLGASSHTYSTNAVIDPLININQNTNLVDPFQASDLYNIFNGIQPDFHFPSIGQNSQPGLVGYNSTGSFNSDDSSQSGVNTDAHMHFIDQDSSLDDLWDEGVMDDDILI